MSTPSVQRRNMVEAQIRANDVVDPRILAAMLEVPRERFVPAGKRALAYADAPLEVSPGRYLLDPRSFARLVALAAINETDSILDVGCATGYSSAILSRLGRSVVALEQDADLVRAASEILPSVGSAGVSVMQGPLHLGDKGRAPFDVIFVNGAIAEPPKVLLGQLAEGGRLVAVVSQDGAPTGTACRFLCEHGRIGTWSAFEAGVPPLVGFSKTVGFVF